MSGHGARLPTGVYALKPQVQRRLQPFVGWAVRRGIAPDAVTLAGLAASLAAAALMALGRAPLLAAGLLLSRLALNVFDGQLARASGRVTARGAVLNELADRMADTAILAAPGWAGIVDARLALLALAGVGLSESAGLVARPRLQGGLLGKGDRVLVLAAALPLGLLTPALWLVGLLSLVTFFQRWRWLCADRSA